MVSSSCTLMNNAGRCHQSISTPPFHLEWHWKRLRWGSWPLFMSRTLLKGFKGTKAKSRPPLFPIWSCHRELIAVSSCLYTGLMTWHEGHTQGAPPGGCIRQVKIRHRLHEQELKCVSVCGVSLRMRVCACLPQQ